MKVDKLDTGIEQIVEDKITLNVEDLVNTKVQEAIEEERDRQSRRRNLLFSNFVESSDSDTEVRKQFDKQNITNFLKGVLKLEDSSYKIELVLRLGKINSNATVDDPRLLKVIFENEAMTDRIMRNARFIKNANEEFKHVKVFRDLTSKAREINKALVNEMKKRNADLEKEASDQNLTPTHKWIVKDLKLIKKNF